MNRTKGDEEEYWNSSKFKAFTFDDEDDELSQLKESKRAVNSLRDFVDDDDDDDLERVSWTGEPVGSISWSIKETAGSSGSTSEGREQMKGRNSFYTQLPKPPSTYSLSSFFRGRTRPGSFSPFLMLCQTHLPKLILQSWGGLRESTGITAMTGASVIQCDVSARARSVH